MAMVFGRAQPWRTAAECLDFEEPSLSIFASPEEARAWAKARKVGLPQRPLAEATMRRIAEGIRRFVLTNADPYIVVTGQQSSDSGKVRPVHGPLSTIVTKAEHCLVTPVVTKFYGASVGAPVDAPAPTHTERAHLGLVAPVLTKFYGTSKAGATVEEPMPTVTAQAGGGHLGVAEAVLAPALVCTTHQDDQDKPVSSSRIADVQAPLPTVTGANRGEWAEIEATMEPAEMITPIILRAHGKGWDKPGKASGVTKPGQPFPTITATEEWSVISPILVQSGYGEREGQAPRALDITKPLGTVVGAGGKHALVSAFMAKHYGGVVGHGLDRPLGTVTSIDHHSLVEADVATTPAQPDRREMVAAFLVLYYGSGGQWQKLDEPMKTIVSKARLGLVEVTLNGVPHFITDIRMRMLTPRELARAQGFPDTYILTGTKAQQIERIGNSVCPPVARAIVEANFGPRARPEQAATS
jgi:DNA (cytosine-5)-methyltransferase 1